MNSLWKDVRHGLRILFKDPTFTGVAVLTLALGIGANTAIFSVVNSVLLRPLGAREPERLVWFWGTQPQLQDAPHSPGDFLDYQSQNDSFEDLAAMRPMSFALTGDNQPVRVNGLIVSANYFSMLGAGPSLGRVFQPDDGRTGATRVALLSDGLWRRRFGGSTDTIGKTLILNGENVAVVGVMPEGFNDYLSLPEQFQPQIWINPHQVVPDFIPNFQGDLMAMRGNNFLAAIGRLKPGVKLEQAQADIDAIHQRIEEQYPYKVGYGVRLVPLYERVVSSVRPALLVLFGAVGLVLLIACGNVANLMMARSTARQKEIAIRTALGASRLRVIRQLLTEGLLLALMGGVCGGLLAAWGVDALVAISPADTPRLSEIKVDYRVLLFTLAVSMLSGIIFALFPALTASRTRLNETLKEGGRSQMSGLGSHRARGALVAAEIAIALVVLIGAGLLVKSFSRLQAVKPGFDPTSLTTMFLWLSDSKYASAGPCVAFLKEIVARLEALPGVQGVAVSNDMPIAGTDTSTYPAIEGRPPADQSEQVLMGIHVVNPGYFEAMRIPILRGRGFDEHDDSQSKAVTIISESMANRFWSNEDPIGKRIGTGQPDGWKEIIGVAGDVRYDGLHERPGMHSYTPHLQEPLPYFAVALRTSLDQASLMAAVRREVQAIDPNQPISDVRTMDETMAQSVASRRFSMMLFSLFAVVALVLTVVGIYGVVAYGVEQRTHEIGIRMALGAQRRDVLKLVINQGMTLASIGVALGLVVSFAMTRLMETLLFEVSATDFTTFAGIGLALAGIVSLASYLPARKAARVDPMVALRYE